MKPHKQLVAVNLSMAIHKNINTGYKQTLIHKDSTLRVENHGQNQFQQLSMKFKRQFRNTSS